MICNWVRTNLVIWATKHDVFLYASKREDVTKSLKFFFQMGVQIQWPCKKSMRDTFFLLHFSIFLFDLARSISLYFFFLLLFFSSQNMHFFCIFLISYSHFNFSNVYARCTHKHIKFRRTFLIFYTCFFTTFANRLKQLLCDWSIQK